MFWDMETCVEHDGNIVCCSIFHTCLCFVRIYNPRDLMCTKIGGAYWFIVAILCLCHWVSQDCIFPMLV